jgi:hypothetical protein
MVAGLLSVYASFRRIASPHFQQFFPDNANKRLSLLDASMLMRWAAADLNVRRIARMQRRGTVASFLPFDGWQTAAQERLLGHFQSHADENGNV